MFDFNSWEFLALGVAAVLIFGPEKLPAMFRKAGEYYGQFQAIANGFRRELEAEVNALADPIKETAAVISEAGRDVAEPLKEAAANVSEAGREMSEPLGEAAAGMAAAAQEVGQDKTATTGTSDTGGSNPGSAEPVEPEPADGDS